MICSVAQEHDSSVVLSVCDLREEIEAGAGGATCSVRTLDGLSCEVCAGELLLLQGGVASGAQSLLEVFAGMRRRVIGNRHVHPRARIRRGAISSAIARVIVSVWIDSRTPSSARAKRSPQDTATTSPRAPVAFLLRVRAPRDGERVSGESRWRDWAERAREGNAAVVLSVPGEFTRRHAGLDTSVFRRAVREPTRAYPSARLRILTLRAGRIVTPPAREYLRVINDSGDASAPSASDPSTTTLTAP